MEEEAEELRGHGNAAKDFNTNSTMNPLYAERDSWGLIIISLRHFFIILLHVCRVVGDRNDNGFTFSPRLGETFLLSATKTAAAAYLLIETADGLSLTQFFYCYSPSNRWGVNCELPGSALVLVCLTLASQSKQHAQCGNYVIAPLSMSGRHQVAARNLS